MKIPFNNIGLDYPRSGEAFAYPEEMEFVMKTKKICSALLSLALSAAVMLPVCGVRVNADVTVKNSGKCGYGNDENLTWKYYTDKTLEITGSGRMIEDWETSSAPPWSSFKDEIEKLIISPDATSIGKNAFNSCTSLTEVTIPKKISYIGPDAFYKCPKVTDVYCYADPASLTWDEDSCDDFYEFNDSTICHVTSKYYRTYLARFEGKVNVTFIGDLPEENNSCGENASWEISGTELTITGTGPITDWTDENKAPWYDQRENITSVSIESGITSIGDSSFSGCSQLVSITIPEGIENIGSNALLDCGALTTFSIPSTVTKIGADAFKGCTSVTEFVCNAASTLTWTDSGCDDFKANKETICKVADVAAYEAKFSKGDSDDVNVTFEENILGSGQCGENATWLLDGDGVLTISGSGAISDCEMSGSPWFSYRVKVTDIVIGNEITSIGNYAFNGCTELTSISIPNSIQRIGIGAFMNCELTSVTIPNGVKTIEASAFQYCESMTSVTMADSVTTIGQYAFADCRNLKTIQLSNKLTLIDEYAFDGSSNVTDIYLKANPVSLTWNNDNNSDYFMENKATTCHVPANVSSLYASKFEDLNATFIGDLGIISKFVGNSITLEDQIGVNFFVDLDKTLNPANVTVSFTWGSGIDATTQESYVHNVTGTLKAVQDPSSHGGAEYVTTCSVAARAMTDTVTMEIRNGNEVIITGECRIVDYADKLATTYNEPGSKIADARLHRLLKAMLTYGGESQKYFDYRINDLASDSKYITNIQETDVYGDGLYTVSDYIDLLKANAQDYVVQYANLDIKNIGTDRPELGIKYNSMSVICTSQTKVRLYFQVSDASKLGDLVIKDINNKTLDISLRKNATSLYYVEISGITPARLYGGMLITINGTEYKFYYEDYMGKCVVLNNKFADTAVALGAYSYFADKYVYGG